MKIKIIFCLVFFLAGILIGCAVKKTANPLFRLGNKEIEIKADNYAKIDD